jgi:hypothetical protein
VQQYCTLYIGLQSDWGASVHGLGTHVCLDVHAGALECMSIMVMSVSEVAEPDSDFFCFLCMFSLKLSMQCWCPLVSALCEDVVNSCVNYLCVRELPLQKPRCKASQRCGQWAVRYPCSLFRGRLFEPLHVYTSACTMHVGSTYTGVAFHTMSYDAKITYLHGF